MVRKVSLAKEQTELDKGKRVTHTAVGAPN